MAEEIDADSLGEGEGEGEGEGQGEGDGEGEDAGFGGAGAGSGEEQSRSGSGSEYETETDDEAGSVEASESETKGAKQGEEKKEEAEQPVDPHYDLERRYREGEWEWCFRTREAFFQRMLRAQKMNPVAWRKEKLQLLEDMEVAPERTFTMERYWAELLVHRAARHAREYSVLQTVMELTGPLEEVIAVPGWRGRALLHYAVQNRWLSADNLQSLVDLCPEAVEALDENGNLPFHGMLWAEDQKDDKIYVLMDAFPDCLQVPDQAGRLPLRIALESPHVSLAVYQTILQRYPQAAGKHAADGKTPFHIALKAVLSTSLPTNKHPHINKKMFQLLLDAFPQAVTVPDGDNVLPLFFLLQTMSSAGLYAPQNEYLLKWIVRLVLTRKVEAIVLTNLPTRDTVLHVMMRNMSTNSWCCGKNIDVVRSVSELVLEYHPEAFRLLNSRNESPLHILISRMVSKELRGVRLEVEVQELSDMILEKYDDLPAIATADGQTLQDMLLIWHNKLDAKNKVHV